MHINSSDTKESDGFPAVIGAGFYSTGTHRLVAALEILGVGLAVLAHDLIESWPYPILVNALEGKGIDLLEVYKPYKSTVG